MRFLIVDDSRAMRMIVTRVLRQVGYGACTIDEAADGAEAVALARDLAPDVVLMDIRMPVMDGIEATGRLAGARVLVLTTFGHEEHVLDALRAGAAVGDDGEDPCLVDPLQAGPAGPGAGGRRRLRVRSRGPRRRPLAPGPTAQRGAAAWRAEATAPAVSSTRV